MPSPDRDTTPPPQSTTPPPEYSESESHLRGIPVVFFPVSTPWIVPASTLDSDSDSDGLPDLQLQADDVRSYNGPYTDNFTEAQARATARLYNGGNANVDGNPHDNENPNPNANVAEDGRNMEWLVRLARAARALTRSAVAQGERIIFDYTDTTLQVVYDTTGRVSADGEPAETGWMSEFFADGNERYPPARLTYQRPIHPPRFMNSESDRVWFPQPTDEAGRPNEEEIEAQWHEILRFLCVAGRRNGTNTGDESPDDAQSSRTSN